MDTNINTCLMWAVGLYTPVDLRYIIDEVDLKDTGVELDSHITLLYAQGKRLPMKSFMRDIETCLGEDDWKEFKRTSEEFEPVPAMELFDLGFFENDSDYLILKLKKDSPVFKWLNIINLSLRTKYGIKSDFDEYTPHITLAELQPGTVNKYLESRSLELLLNDSMVDFEGIMVSYGFSNEPDDRKQYFLTQYKNVDRYFRMEHLKRDFVQE